LPPIESKVKPIKPIVVEPELEEEDPEEKNVKRKESIMAVMPTPEETKAAKQNLKLPDISRGGDVEEMKTLILEEPELNDDSQQFELAAKKGNLLSEDLEQMSLKQAVKDDSLDEQQLDQ
jgi:hypothetical protein